MRRLWTAGPAGPGLVVFCMVTAFAVAVPVVPVAPHASYPPALVLAAFLSAALALRAAPASLGATRWT